MTQIETPRHHERRNHKWNRRRVATLERRRDFLATRAGSDRSESYDEAEYRALCWAIRALRQWMDEDPYWIRVGRHWRELGFAYVSEHDPEEWIVWEREGESRAATDAEIALAQREIAAQELVDLQRAGGGQNG